MKTKEELIALKEEVETLNKKLAELNEDELEQVSGGHDIHTITKNDIDRGGLQLGSDDGGRAGGAGGGSGAAMSK